MVTNMEYKLNDIVEMKKAHPCKKSTQCGAIVMFPRREFEKKLKKIIE